MNQHHCPHPGDLIVTAATTRPGPMRDVLRAYADRLTTTGVFTHLTHADTRTVAAAIAHDVLDGDESTALRHRAAVIASGHHGGVDDPTAVAYAYTIAATVLDLM